VIGADGQQQHRVQGRHEPQALPGLAERMRAIQACSKGTPART
jgi:hypothetical protein